MKLINKRFILGEELPSGATVSIKIEVFDNGDELFITYAAFRKDKQKGGTATVKRNYTESYLLKRISFICNELILP